MRQSNIEGMTPRQFAVLLCVDVNEDISQTGLVTATGIDRSTLADVVRRLVGRGWLSRRRTRTDARTYAVRITPKGKVALTGASPAAKKADSLVIAGLSTNQRHEFIATLTAIVQNMDLLVLADAA